MVLRGLVGILRPQALALHLTRRKAFMEIHMSLVKVSILLILTLNLDNNPLL